MKKINSIIIVTPDFFPHNISGCGISSYLLANELHKRGYTVNVQVFGKKVNHSYPYELSSYNSIQKIPILNNIFSLISLLRIKKYDIAHTYPELMPSVVLSGIAKKVIVTLNSPKGVMNQSYASDNFFHRFHAYLTSLFISAFKSFPCKYLALTPSVKRMYSSENYKNISVVPNMFDPYFFCNSEKKTIDFLYCGKLSQSKGLKTLLLAAQKLLDENQNFKLLIVGKGKLKTWADNFIRTNSLFSQVKITSVSYKQLPKLYSKAKIFIQPVERFEPFSRTWLEAMRHNNLIISSDNPSAFDVLPTDSIFFERGNFNDLSMKMKIALNSFQPRSYSSELNHYNPNKVIEAIINHYKTC